MVDIGGVGHGGGSGDMYDIDDGRGVYSQKKTNTVSLSRRSNPSIARALMVIAFA
jgi:hypothetical protein